MTSRTGRLIAPVLIALVAMLLTPALSQASPRQVVRDCAKDGSVDGKYSNADKRAAIKLVTGDLDEYSDCKAAIRASISANPKAGTASVPGVGGGTSGGGSAGGGGGTSSAGAAAAAAAGDAGTLPKGANPAAVAAQAARQRSAARSKLEAALGPRGTDPTKVALIDPASTRNGLPLPVLLSVIALGLLALMASSVVMGRRYPALGEGAGRVPGMMRRIPLPRRLRSVSLPRPFRR